MKLENGEFSMIDSMIEQTISVVENLEKRLHEIGEKQKIMEKKLEKVNLTKIKEKPIAICASAH
jgi:hypothetical protein